MGPPAVILCPDCGGRAHLVLEDRPDDPYEPGDTVVYRCEDCADRWDVVFEDDGIEEDVVFEDDGIEEDDPDPPTGGTER